jgi:exosortase O
LSLRWVAVGAAIFLILVSANAARVAVLVLVSEVFKQQRIAEIIHVSLGIVGLVGACFVTWLMLQRVPKFQPKKISGISANPTQKYSKITL